jgi:hypothetical protein
MNYSNKQDHLLSRKQAADFLGGICKTTLDRLGIPQTKVRRRVFYRQDILEKWLQDHTQVQEATHGK